MVIKMGMGHGMGKDMSLEMGGDGTEHVSPSPTPLNIHYFGIRLSSRARNGEPGMAWHQTLEARQGRAGSGNCRQRAYTKEMQGKFKPGG